MKFSFFVRFSIVFCVILTTTGIAGKRYGSDSMTKSFIIFDPRHFSGEILNFRSVILEFEIDPKKKSGSYE
ncbi:hypothetical protein JYT44_01045, partial [Caldithrix abyssi]|nr:hypothetical protein [Caldithrix abyssi]